MFYYNFETTSEIVKYARKPHSHYMSAEALSEKSSEAHVYKVNVQLVYGIILKMTWRVSPIV